jgi:hypothetical protein
MQVSETWEDYKKKNLALGFDIWELLRSGLQHHHLFSIGVFFTSALCYVERRRE